MQKPPREAEPADDAIPPTVPLVVRARLFQRLHFLLESQRILIVRGHAELPGMIIIREIDAEGGDGQR